MRIETRDFGELEIDEQDIIRLKSPIYGFEDLMEFVVLYEEENSHIVWLQSVEDSQICFVMVDPAVVDKNYKFELPREARRLLGDDEGLLVWLIVVVAPDFKDSTVNLKSPVIINPARHCGLQAMLEEDYPIRYPLMGEGRGNR